MRRLQFIWLILPLLAVGCQVERVGGGAANPSGGAVLELSLPQTRTALGEKVDDSYPVSWSEGDRIVVNGTLSDSAEIDAADRQRAIFSVNPAPKYPVSVTYPYCAATSAEHPMVNFPAEQRYVEGSFAPGSAPMCGYAEGEGDRIVLSHLAAILRIPIKAEVADVILSRVVVTSLAGAPLAGDFKVDCRDASITPTQSFGSSVTYLLPDGFALSTTDERVLYISLPAIDVGACTIEFVEASGKKMTLNWTPSAPLSGGVVREFGCVSYQTELKRYADEGEIKIMSFNVRVETSESDAANNWSNRKVACVALIKDHQPAVIGFQEAKYTSQWSYLKQELADDYSGFGVNRDSGLESGKGEVMGILYNKGVVERLDGGTFWLSETPDVPSKGFGANYSRNATWGLFRHKPSGKIFYYINTHLDHQVANAQVEGMKLISKRFEEYKGRYPLFLTGDLNITADNVAIDPIEGYMYNARVAAPSFLTDFNTTYNGYKTNKSSIIDHIYCSNYLRVVEYHTINEQYGGVEFVSDHYPVYAIVELQ